MKNLIKNSLQFFGYSLERSQYNNKHSAIFRKNRENTMIPYHSYIDNLMLIENLIKNVKGDVVECGVWRGGMIAGIAQMLEHEERLYHLFDSFEGLPNAKMIDGQSALAWQQNTEGTMYYDNCRAEINFAISAMEKTGCQYHIHKGWFSETLPHFVSNNGLALLRLDGDWYDSTIVCLQNLYPKVNERGLIIIDDYYTWDGCCRAVHDYLSSIKSKSRIKSTKNGVCYIIKLD